MMTTTATDPTVHWLNTRVVSVPDNHILPTARRRHERSLYYDIQPLIDHYGYAIISAGQYLHQRGALAAMVCGPRGLSADAAFHVDLHDHNRLWAKRAIAADIALDCDTQLAIDWATAHSDPHGQWLAVGLHDVRSTWLSGRSS